MGNESGNCQPHSVLSYDIDVVVHSDFE